MFLTMNAWGNTGIYGSLKGSLRKPLDCHGWVLDETQKCRCSPFQYRLVAEVWTSGGSPEGDRGAEAKSNGQTDTMLRSIGANVDTKMICFDSERVCVRLKAFQDMPVRKMAVGGSIPCFVSRSLTLWMIINASTS